MSSKYGNHLAEIICRREKDMVIVNSLENLSESPHLASRFHCNKNTIAYHRAE
jgi:hypothetical protein